jgi:putative SOS response-associated peptidase YedK
MPVIVPPEAFDFWLDYKNVDAETAASLIVPLREGALDIYPVSNAVSRTANDAPALIEPVAEQPEESAVKAKPKPKNDDGQASLF